MDDSAFKLTTPEHSDSGFLTILTTFGYHGLQVLMDGEYKSIRPVPNTLIVNIGDLLSKLTGYKLKSTYHRVLDIGIERFSAPVFFEPKYSARICESIMESKRETINDPDFKHEDLFLFGDWLLKRLITSYVEWKDYTVPESRRVFIENIDIKEFKQCPTLKGKKYMG